MIVWFLPAFVDAHVHFDKTYVPLVNTSGTLQEAIELWVKEKSKLDELSYEQRALKAVKQALLNGTTFIRTHIDIDASYDLRALTAILQVREKLRDSCDIQIVALGNPGADETETIAMKEALELGADLVGGAPALTQNPERCIDAAFDLAERYDKDIDLHIDETEDPEIKTLEYLAEQTLERGFQGRVTAGHCCSLSFMPDEVAARIIDKVAEAELNIITLPSCNLNLMGRGRHPIPCGSTRVKDLLETDVNVAAASDNVQDPFNPFGQYDALMNANLIAHTAHMSSPLELKACLDMVTKNAAKITGEKSELKAGEPANLVILDTTSKDDIVTTLPKRLATFYRGKCIVQQAHTYEWKIDGFDSA